MSSGTCSPLGQGHATQNQRGTDGCLKGERLVEGEDAPPGGDDRDESPKDVALQVRVIPGVRKR